NILRDGDAALLDVLFVITLDAVGTIRVVHHQSKRLKQTLFRNVAHPIDAFDRSSVVQVEASDRIERAAVAARRQVLRAGAAERFAARIARCHPVERLREPGTAETEQMLGLRKRGLALGKPLAEAWYGRQRNVIPQA